MSTNKRVTDNLIDNLLLKPTKDKGINAPHFPEFQEDFYHQADLLFLPSDDDYKYALVVVDVGSKMVDARPLKSKESKEIVKAFKSIYSGKYLHQPKEISVDSGNEFKGDVATYLKGLNIYIKTALPGRHKQQAFVERKNRDIGKSLNKIMLEEELITGETSTSWKNDLDEVVKEINENTKKTKSKKKVSTKLNEDYLCKGDTCNLIEQGTKVRVALDVPKDVTSGKRLHGTFREGDIRFDVKPRTVVKTLIAPGTVPMYALDKDNGQVDNRVLYTKNQLQIIPPNEKKPTRK